jgi:hypothetical protein
VVCSYFELTGEVTRLITKKQMVDWAMYVFNNETFCQVHKSFLIAANQSNQLGLKAVHFYTGNPQLDNKVGETREQILESVVSLVKDFLSKQSASQLGFHKTIFKSVVGDIAGIVSESLIDTVNQKASIFQVLDLSDKVKQSVLLQLRFIGAICTKNNLYYTHFQNYSILIFKMVVLPLAKTCGDEKDKMEDNPSDFVSYALDLCGFHKSETPKTELLNMFEYLIENVDGCLTKSFHILFGMLSETVSDAPGQVLLELAEIDKLKEFSAEDRLDVSLLLFSNMSYMVGSRSDLISMLKGFVLGHLDKFLSIQSVLLVTRLLMFFSQYVEYFYDSPQDAKYIQSIMRYIATCMLEEKSHPVVIFFDQDQAPSSRVPQ